jgi:hypothetical protein
MLLARRAAHYIILWVSTKSPGFPLLQLQVYSAFLANNRLYCTPTERLQVQVIAIVCKTTTSDSEADLGISNVTSFSWHADVTYRRL